MGLRFSVSDIAKGFVDAIVKEMQRPIAKAATATIREAGKIAKRDGRASIAAAGFSRKWQNALRVNIYPPRGDSMRPAAFIFHKIRYAGVFEEGAVIGGQPFLWLPLPTVPLRRGRPMNAIAICPLDRPSRIGPASGRPAASLLQASLRAGPPAARWCRRRAQAALRRPFERRHLEALQYQGGGSERGGAVAFALCQASVSRLNGRPDHHSTHRP